MIVIHVQVQIKPEVRAEFIQEARQEVAQAQKEAGCRQYAWSEDLNHPQQFVLYEEWESQADFDAYKASDFFKHLQSVFMPLLAGEPQSHYYTAAPLG